MKISPQMSPPQNIPQWKPPKKRYRKQLEDDDIISPEPIRHFRVKKYGFMIKQNNYRHMNCRRLKVIAARVNPRVGIVKDLEVGVKIEDGVEVGTKFYSA